MTDLGLLYRMVLPHYGLFFVSMLINATPFPVSLFSSSAGTEFSAAEDCEGFSAGAGGVSVEQLQNTEESAIIGIIQFLFFINFS